MKRYILFLVFLITYCNLSAQTDFISVLEVTGKVYYKKNTEDQRQRLKNSSKLSEGYIIVSENSSVHLVSPVSKQKILTKANEYDVSLLVKELNQSEDKNFFERLSEYLKKKLSSKKNENYGLATIEGAIKKSSKQYIEFDFPGITSLLRKEYTFQTAKNIKEAKLLINAGSETIYSGNFLENKLKVNFLELLKDKPDVNDLVISVIDKYGDESKEKRVSFFSPEKESEMIKNYQLLLASLENSKNIAEKHLMIGAFYEVNNLIYDSYLEYLTANEAGSGNPEIKDLIDSFIEKNDFDKSNTEINKLIK